MVELFQFQKSNDEAFYFGFGTPQFFYFYA